MLAGAVVLSLPQAATTAIPKKAVASVNACLCIVALPLLWVGSGNVPGRTATYPHFRLVVPDPIMGANELTSYRRPPDDRAPCRERVGVRAGPHRANHRPQRWRRRDGRCRRARRFVGPDRDHGIRR